MQSAVRDGIIATTDRARNRPSPTRDMTDFCSLAELAAAVPDGSKLAIPPFYAGPAMAATRELVRRRVRDLHIVCVPQSGLQADILIGAGAVRAVETSAVTLGEAGPAPRFTAAVRSGAVRVLDATCPAIHAGLLAAQKGVPFMPIRGILGSDLLVHRPDWRIVDNPFAAGDAIVAVPAIRPDVALFHAQLADREGNVFIGRSRELLNMAQAAASAFVTVEEIVAGDLIADEARAGAVLPAIYVGRVAVAPRGAAPHALGDAYPADDAFVARYAAAARTEEGFRAFVDEWLAA
jgi:glutaconate CoA-transferase, subunit A